MAKTQFLSFKILCGTVFEFLNTTQKYVLRVFYLYLLGFKNYNNKDNCVRNVSAQSEILCLITRHSLIGIMAVKEKIESGYRNGERDGTKLWGWGSGAYRRLDC